MNDSSRNILPYPSEAYLLESFFNPHDSSEILQHLIEEVHWQQREILIFGKKILQPRLVAWQGDPGCSYRYSGITWNPDSWTRTVKMIRSRVEELVGVSFNGVLLNWYRDGRDSMGRHSDDEPELGVRPVIASVSLGADRRFLFRKKENPREKVEVILRTGSLLVMKAETQSLWQHELPKMVAVKGARINLTFRKIVI